MYTHNTFVGSDVAVLQQKTSNVSIATLAMFCLLGCHVTVTHRGAATHTLYDI